MPEETPVRNRPDLWGQRLDLTTASHHETETAGIPRDARQPGNLQQAGQGTGVCPVST